MRVIDRYILLKYLTSFIFCLMLFTAIAVVIDISEKTDDFTKSGLSNYQIFKDYYLGFIPRIDAMLFPLFVFISVIFFTSKMAGRSEIIAILSSGVNYRRFMVPYIAGALVLATGLWLGYRYVVPPANKKWGDFSKKYIDVNNGISSQNNSSYKTNIYFKLDKNNYVGIKGYDTISKTGSNFFLQTFKDNQLQYNLRSTNFTWDSAAKKWKLFNVSERFFHELNETVVNTTDKLISYNFRPIDLRRDDYLKDQMTTPELNDFISREKARGSDTLSTLLVERYNRDAIPASVIILTIIGAVLASRKVRGGSGAHIALGVLLSMVYILFSRFSGVFATKGNFTPLLASWTPNILFGILAVILYRRASS